MERIPSNAFVSIPFQHAVSSAASRSSPAKTTVAPSALLKNNDRLPSRLSSLGGAAVLAVTLSSVQKRKKKSSRQIYKRRTSALSKVNLQAVPSAVAPAPLLAPQLEDNLLRLLDRDAAEDEVLRLAGELEELGGQAAVPEVVRGNWDLRWTSTSKFDVTAPLGRRVDGSAPGLEAVVPTLMGTDDKQEELQASSSPVQRWVTSTFKSAQNINDDRVDTMVSFGSAGLLRLSAAAQFDEEKPQRLNFTFDLAYFELFGIRIPYPVPFKLLGDEAKGWIETTYASDKLRISRGNKGTVFVLLRASSQGVMDSSLGGAESSEDSSSGSLSKVGNGTSVVVLPGLGNDSADYEEFVASLEARGFSASTVPVARPDWLRNALGLSDPKWWLGTLEPRPVLDWYLERVDRTVNAAKGASEDGRVVLLGHSAGGWLARVYLCGYCERNESSRSVKKLVTLGTPHLPPDEDGTGSFDQTRGLLSYVQQTYTELPEGIEAASVGSRFLQGSGDISDVGAFVAGVGYQQVCGKADVWGDGIVPVPSMKVPGWQWREVSSVWHSPIGAADGKWYGDNTVLDEWVDLLA